MDFAQPSYLYLLILIPMSALLFAWAARRQQSNIARIGSPSLIAVLSASVSEKRRRWKMTLWFIALIALVVALARPRWGTQVHVTAQRGVQVMVVLDVSASMLAEDVKPSRLERAKLTVEELMDRLGGNEVGLVLFSGAAFVQFPLTADFNTARSFLNAAGPSTISRPGTALEEAIRVALTGFPEEIASNRVILLLTDGEGHEGDPIIAARAAAEAGAGIYAIGFGSPTGEPIPIRDDNGALTGYKQNAQGETVFSYLDEGILQQIVDKTGGLYFRASAGGEEIAAITDAISALETGDLAHQFETRGVERFDWFAGLTLLALAAELLISERVKSGPGKKYGKLGIKFHVPRASDTTLCVIFILSGLFLSACSPDVVERNNSGNDRFREGALDDAITEYRQAQVSDPDRAEPYYNAANAFNRQGQIDMVQAQSQQALKTAHPDLAAETWYNLGNAYFDSEAWSDAISAYQEALRLNPGDVDAKHNLELALQKLEEQQQEQQKQQQNPQEQDQPQEQNESQESADRQQSDTNTPTPTPGTQADNSGQSQAVDERQDEHGMTPEQALQLLQALIGNAETLQERLREVQILPGPPPEKDW